MAPAGTIDSTVASPETLQVRPMVDIARALNPHVRILIRSHHNEVAALLEHDIAGSVFVGDAILSHADREMLSQIDRDIQAASPLACIGQEMNLVLARGRRGRSAVVHQADLPRLRRA